jgi:gp32 DNA binding protein like
MSSLANLKKNSSLSKLTKALQQTSQQSGSKDDRYWQPEVDKAGNGFAMIRFLDAPAIDGEDGLPWVTLFTHGFQGPGGWYIENSRTTLGRDNPDPVSDFNSKLWDSGIEANKEIARKQKRRLSYIANIMVLKDPNHPENEGKVFLYSFGKKIFDKIRMQIAPTDEEIAGAALEGIKLEPVNVISFWEGKNFRLKIRKVEGYRNYDTSVFEEAITAVADNDKDIEAIWKKEYSLKALVAPDQFKSYADLEARLNKVLGLDGAPPASKSTVKSKPVQSDDDDATPPWDSAANVEKVAPAAKVTEKEIRETPAKKVSAPKVPVADKAPAVSDEDDSMLNMFRGLADQE